MPGYQLVTGPGINTPPEHQPVQHKPEATISLKDYAYNETRYSSLADTDAKTAVDLLEARSVGSTRSIASTKTSPPSSGYNKH
jgi:hypothetical protein